jgi:hypothetical protein
VREFPPLVARWVRVAKAGDAISTAESTMANFALNEGTLIHPMKTGFS